MRGALLALRHSVEGSELSVMRGAGQVMARDMPLLVTELNVHASPRYSRELLEHVAALGYASYLVEEVCGVQMDCRNVLHVPRRLLARLRAY